jgi:hypothetical protein
MMNPPPKPVSPLSVPPINPTKIPTIDAPRRAPGALNHPRAGRNVRPSPVSVSANGGGQEGAASPAWQRFTASDALRGRDAPP